MKKLLYLFLVTPLLLFAQEQDPCYSINDYNILTQAANPPILLDLLSGWNMIGYGCYAQIDTQDLLESISDKIIVVKNNAGLVYIPEFGFNGLGNLLPNQGYYIKMSEAVIGFELCSYHINYHQIDGCTDCEATNFNQWANIDDGSCQYNICTDPVADNYQEVLPCIYYGCNNPLAANYDPYANTDDGSCVVAEACPYDNYLEYSPNAISYNENLCVNIIVEGCIDNTALNYNSQANLDDESCEYIYGCIETDAYNYNAEATTNDGSCIYYGCMDPTAGNYDETANTDDGTCLIGGCMNTTANNYNADAGIDDGSCIIYGCTLSSFPNYNSQATIGDGSCDMNSLDVFGCTDDSALAYNYVATIDDGTCYIIPIGTFMQGGIVFYVDETGQHGLVAAMEDLGSFEWGCYGTTISGADGQAIGTGYQNTFDIVAGCSEINTAAFNALNASIEGFTDWYLPSKDELQEMYSTIGYGGPQGNIGGFELISFNADWFWSSAEFISGTESNFAWSVRISDGIIGGGSKDDTFRVRVIRAF